MFFNTLKDIRQLWVLLWVGQWICQIWHHREKKHRWHPHQVRTTNTNHPQNNFPQLTTMTKAANSTPSPQRRRKPRRLTAEELKSVLGLSQTEAANSFGIHRVTLKRNFARLKKVLNLSRWPSPNKQKSNMSQQTLKMRLANLVETSEEMAYQMQRPCRFLPFGYVNPPSPQLSPQLEPSEFCPQTTDMDLSSFEWDSEATEILPFDLM